MPTETGPRTQPELLGCAFGTTLSRRPLPVDKARGAVGSIAQRSRAESRVPVIMTEASFAREAMMSTHRLRRAERSAPQRSTPREGRIPVDGILVRGEP